MFMREMAMTGKRQVVAIWATAVVILTLLSLFVKTRRRLGIIILHTMTYPRVYWKGLPHHHPQIQVISSHSSAGNRASAQIAAEQVLRRPFSPLLVRARRRQVCKVFLRTRKSPNSRRSSSTIITIRKKTSRAKHNLQVYGWDSSTAEVANYVQTRRRPSAIQISTSAQPRPVLPAHIVIRKPKPIPSLDGAVCSTSRQPSEKDKRKEVTVSFHHAPLYATTNHIPPRITKQSPTGSSFSTRPHSVYTSRGQEGGYRTYDSRITPVNRLKREQHLHPSSRPAGPWPVPTRPTGLRRPIHPQATSAENPRRPIASTTQKPLTSMSVSNTTANSNYCVSISRTPSERKALKKFTKELERHLQAAKDLPQRASVASLPSITTTISVRTVAELVPYKSEFHAAGLAITSDEQRGMAFGWSSKNKRAPTPPPAVNRPEKSRYDYENVKSSKKQARQPSYASGSTGTTVMGFTPPHEKNYDVPQTPIPRRHSSSDHTVLGFTPPHEIVARVTSSSPKQSTKKSLPWLRKQESPKPEFALTKKNTVHEDDVIKEMRIVGGPSLSFSSPKPDDDGRARQFPGYSPNPHLSPKNKKEIPAVNRELSMKEYDRVGTKLVSQPSRNKSSTVTPRTPARLSTRKVSSLRQPELGVVSKACPLNESRCAGDCQPDPKVSTTRTRSRTPPPSRSQLETISNSCLDDSDGGAVPEPSPPVEEFQPKKEQSPFLFDFGFQARSRSPKSTKTENEKRQLPSNELDERRKLGLKALEEDIQTKQGSRIVDYTSAIRNIGYQSEDQHSDPPVHACTANSSQTCQECFPTRESSIAISPLQTPPPREKVKSSPAPNASTYSKNTPVADAVKRSSPSASQRKAKRPVSSLSRPRPSPRVLNPATNSKPAMKQAASTTSLDTYLPQASQVSDKAVFRGLHVATAAACDEDLDKWIEDLTGFSARQFLADLSKFEGLGVNTLANVAKRAAKQRREEVRGWENLRRERRGARGNAGEEEGE